jgi:formylglycine-generating enzyme required for sulfatase activity
MNTIGSSESLSRKKSHPLVLVLVLTGALLCWAQAGCGDPSLRSDWYGCSVDAGLGCPAGMVCLTVPDGGGEQRCYTVDPSCGPETCLGCCDPSDECQAGDQDQLCGKNGAACEDCTSETDGFCSGQTCQSSDCIDNDNDGRGEDCTLGPDACDGDSYNWTASGCANCTDVDGDGYGTDCDLAEDPCDDDEHNWTVGGCTGCTDVDGDGYGTDCDLGEDCDDGALGITVGCQTNGCPEGWAYIPTGNFEMGCDGVDTENHCRYDEEPIHTVTLNAYCLEVTEVSVAAYRACQEAGVCTGTPTEEGESFNWSASPESREAHPINGINWLESRQYCQLWLGGDLPTEAQWEKGARGDEGTRKYPWGGSSEPEPDCSRCNFDVNDSDFGFGCDPTTTPYTWEVGHLTGTEGDSPYGLKDMTGNVFEWVQDLYQSLYYGSCESGCTDPLNDNPDPNTRVIRGGAFSKVAFELRLMTRDHRFETFQADDIGFRCRRTP